MLSADTSSMAQCKLRAYFVDAEISDLNPIEIGQNHKLAYFVQSKLLTGPCKGRKQPVAGKVSVAEQMFAML